MDLGRRVLSHAAVAPNIASVPVIILHQQGAGLFARVVPCRQGFAIPIPV